MRLSIRPQTWLWGVLAAGVVGAGAPAFAQPTTVEELTVTARYGPTGEVRSLSQAVSFADLDLTSDAGRTALRERVRSTAHDLCVKLGEDPHLQVPPVPSCEQAAIGSVADQMRTAEAQAQPKNLAAAAPPPAPAAAPAAPAAPAYASPTSATSQTVTNGPVPDTPDNRKKYGGPMSRAGKRTQPSGN